MTNTANIKTGNLVILAINGGHTKFRVTFIDYPTETAQIVSLDGEIKAYVSTRNINLA